MDFRYLGVLLFRLVVIAISLFLFFVSEGTSRGTDLQGRSIGVLCLIIASALTFYFLFSHPKTSLIAPDRSKHRRPIALSLITMGLICVLFGFYFYPLSNPEIGIDHHSLLAGGGGLVLFAGIDIWRNNDRSGELATLLGFVFVLSGGLTTLVGLYLWWVFMPLKSTGTHATQADAASQ